MLNLFSSLITLGTNWLKGKQQLQKSKIDQEVAESKQKTKLISDARTNNHSWELAALSADRLASLRQFSFWLFTAPILYTVYDPEAAVSVWASLSTVPDWIIGVQLTMTGFIWAAKPLTNVGAMLAGKVR
ncbi:hypothetical protein [Endozoicomonas ascidiicola]|uniref:hypothetical protein n=1 Tax=Endozoicomonas ascidiicola TaxID=1698521 RepID=UPI00082DBDCF|nr:hypothetical protein [Endozoicomonas ascidiicola]